MNICYGGMVIQILIPGYIIIMDMQYPVILEIWMMMEMIIFHLF